MATFGLRNALFPVGHQLLEVVSPVEQGTTAGRWSEVLGRPVAGATPTITLDEGDIRFVPSGDRGEGVSAFELGAAAGADPVDTVIAGTRLFSR